jgi:hypothetical protein
MGVPDCVGDQHLHRLPGQFVAPVPEQPLGLGVDQHDPPITVDADHGVRRRLQQAAESRLGPFGLGQRGHQACPHQLGRTAQIRQLGGAGRGHGRVVAARGHHPGRLPQCADRPEQPPTDHYHRAGHDHGHHHADRHQGSQQTALPGGQPGGDVCLHAGDLRLQCRHPGAYRQRVGPGNRDVGLQRPCPREVAAPGRGELRGGHPGQPRPLGGRSRG